MTKHSHFPYRSTYRSTLHNTNRKYNIYHIPIHKHSKDQEPLSSTTAATLQTLTQTPLSHYNIYKNKLAPYTHIYCILHLATRGNNKILRTPPLHISSSEEIMPSLMRRTIAQLRTNKSPFLKSYFHKVDAKSHPFTTMAPL